MKSDTIVSGKRDPIQAAEADSTADDPRRFDWPLAYEGEQFLRECLEGFLRQNSFARRLAERMRDETGTDFFEWIDHLVMGPKEERSLVKAGFVRDELAETPNGEIVYEHPRATLPRVLL